MKEASGERDKWLSMDDAHFLRDCRQEFFKASGKGGQKVNKTSSAVRLTHIPSGVAATASESRSQTENRSKAIRKLRMDIAIATRGGSKAPQTGDLPSLRNPAYPLWAAALLDILHRNGWDLKPSADELGVSPSKLAKILHRDPDLWQEAGRRRSANGLPPLKAV